MKISQIRSLISLLLILISCSSGKDEEIQKLTKQKIQIEKKISDYANRLSNAEKSDQIKRIAVKYQSLIDEALNFNVLCKRSQFENNIQLFDEKKLNKIARDCNVQFEKMENYEKQQKIYERTKHICFENKENIVDVEGNIYRTIKIGSQHWMAENLKTKRFNNGEEIKEACVEKLWNTTYYYEPKLCISDESVFYDGNVVIDTRNVCPTGWHVPTDIELMKLVNYLGGVEFSGISLKDINSWNRTDGYSDYKYPKGTNKSGFEALAVGFKAAGGALLEKGESAGFWSSSQTDDHYPDRGRDVYYNVWCYRLSYRQQSIWRVQTPKNSGFSIRCIED